METRSVAKPWLGDSPFTECPAQREKCSSILQLVHVQLVECINCCRLSTALPYRTPKFVLMAAAHRYGL